MGFSRQEYWSGLPFPSPGDLPDPGIEPRCPTLQAETLYSEPPGNPSVRVSLVSLWQVNLVFLFLEISTFCPYFGITLSLGIEF